MPRIRFLFVNCADFARDCYHQDPNVRRNVVRVPARSVHWFPGSVQFGIKALPYKGHNLRNKGHPTMGRMPCITIQCWVENMTEEQRTRIYAGPHIGQCPMTYRPYRMNQYLCTEDRMSENQHHLIHQSNLLRVGGPATIVMSGESALRLLAINGLAQAYEQLYDTGKEDEDDDDIVNSCAGNSEAVVNQKPAAKESSEEDQTAKESSEEVDII